MAAKVTIDLVTDTRDFERQMRSASAATAQFKAATDKQGAALDDASHAFGDARSQIKGSQALLKGLHQTLGANTQATIDNLSGYANLAKGIKAGFIPALTLAQAKVKAFSATLLATPWGRIAAVVVGLGAAFAAASSQTDQFGKAVGAIKHEASEIARGWRIVANSILNIVGVSASATMSLDQLNKAGMQVSGLDPLKPKGGGVAVGDLKNYSGNGDTSWSGMYDASKIRKAYEDAMAAAADKTAKGGANVAKAAATAAEKALKSAADKYIKIVDKALDKFKAKVEKAKALKQSLKDLFNLDFEGSDYRDVPSGLRSQLARWEKFVKVFGELKKKKLDPGLLSMFADAGPAALDEMNKVNHASIRDINDISKRAEGLRDSFARSETIRRTGVDPDKPGKVKVTLDIKGSSGDLKALIKKWVREEGGGNVQVAFGK